MNDFDNFLTVFTSFLSDSLRVAHELFTGWCVNFLCILHLILHISLSYPEDEAVCKRQWFMALIRQPIPVATYMSMLSPYPTLKLLFTSTLYPFPIKMNLFKINMINSWFFHSWSILPFKDPWLWLTSSRLKMDTVSSAPRIQVSAANPTVQDDGFQSLSAHARHTGTMKQSRPLPRWLWYIIAKSLGIKTNPKDKPWFATILYILTLLCTVGYVITNTWYTIADIVSENTTFDSLNGTIDIMMSISFCAVSVYANDLAYRLFTNRLFLQSVRLHTKTFLKVNSAFIIGLLGLMFIGLYNFENRALFCAKTCTTLMISPWLCYVQYPCLLGVTAFSFLWNMLVAVVCLSVCRTHTISKFFLK